MVKKTKAQRRKEQEAKRSGAALHKQKDSKAENDKGGDLHSQSSGTSDGPTPKQPVNPIDNPITPDPNAGLKGGSAAQKNAEGRNIFCRFIYWICRNMKRQFVTNWLIVILYCGLAWFAYDQLRLTRDTAHRQLRAYVIASYAELKEVDKSGRMIIVVAIKNSGVTPAKQMKMITNFQYDEKSDKNIPDDQSEIDLAGGDTHYSDDGRQLTGEQIERLTNRTFPVRVYGEIEYFDIFDEFHKSSFDFYSDPDSGIQPHHFFASPKGNWFDHPLRLAGQK